MKLWIVDANGWDTEITIVRAMTAEDAVRLAGAYGDPEELVPDGPEAVRCGSTSGARRIHVEGAIDGK